VEVACLVPLPGDLPGSGWVPLDEPVSGGTAGEAELIDCVGPSFPPAGAVVDSAASPHFLRPPHQLVHGLAVVFDDPATAAAAASVLAGADFARCLGRSVAADLVAVAAPAELLAVDLVDTGPGHRVTFTGASPAGVRPVHLDLVTLHAGTAVALLWFGDTPAPFPREVRHAVTAAVEGRLRRWAG
jgi:hypothetical protein